MATYTPNYNLSKPESTDDYRDFLNSYGDNMDKIDNNMGGGGSGGGHTIVDPNGTDMPQENKLQFTGAVNVSDDSVNGQTVVDVEGGGNYYLNTIYSTKEKKVGYWTDSKPLYQKTAYISNISISANSSTNVNISDHFSDVDNVVNFECCDENGNAIFPNVMVNSGLSPYSIGVTIDKSTDHITFTRGSGSSATISVYLTLWYTKTTDTPELNPQTGGVIYLPTIYSDEEREVGVWRDGKPLYQKTVHVGALVQNSSWHNVPHGVANLDKCISIEAICIATNGTEFYPINLYRPTTNTGVMVYATASDVYYINNYYSEMEDAYFTIRYTKTTDVAGSGSWTPSGAKAVHYSTNEQVIGTWVDGKPLYEKTISFGSLPNNTQKNVAHGISDVDIIVKCEGIAYDSSYKSISVPYSNVDSVTYQLQLEVNRTNVSIKAKINFTGYIGYITLQYTKTTD